MLIFRNTKVSFWYAKLCSIRCNHKLHVNISWEFKGEWKGGHLSAGGLELRWNSSNINCSVGIILLMFDLYTFQGYAAMQEHLSGQVQKLNSSISLKFVQA